MVSLPRILIGEKLPSAMKYDFIDGFRFNKIPEYVSFRKESALNATPLA